VRFDLAILKPEALERSPDDIILDSEQAPDGNTEISGERLESLKGWRFRDPDRSADSVPRETPHLAAKSSRAP
jgi:hypothetical protein